jgi:hypothetical protein
MPMTYREVAMLEMLHADLMEYRYLVCLLVLVRQEA